MTRTRIVVAASLAGLAVLSFLIGSSILNSGRVLAVDGFQRTADPMKIVVFVTIGLLDDFADRTVIEDAASVKVIVRVRSRSGTSDAIGVPVPLTLSLREPLASRTVVDGSGRAVRDLGTFRMPATSP